MNEFVQRIEKLSPKRLALLALELQSKLEANEGRRREPVAIIGLGCRFPGGADGPEAYWRLLSEERDAIVEVPQDRWDVNAYYDPDPERPGKMNTRWGGFLNGIDLFEPQFFGISPRESASMDPQQRLLLEVAWEALEHAGQAPDSLGKSRTGVFVGICGSDYYQMLMESAAGASNTYLATGTTHSVASGRLSYVLGLQGPSVSIDTACSSSLVAIHLACQSLNDDECRMALAGGVNVILSPEPTVALSTARMMAPDGRCKAFDSRANGFVRAEGCGIVVLKRLSDAIADGDRVLAVIRGSAVNQDGRSSGLTAPNGPSQEAVVKEALKRAGVTPAEISYVEAHGTGTSLGDPIEAQALASATGIGRPADRPLMIGSVKTNIGHLEAAAGVAGLIKVVLALQHERIPAQLHLQKLNPHIPWSDLRIRVTAEAQPWMADGRRLAGVSSFGFSGTNAHVILGEAPATQLPGPPGRGRSHHLCCISARSETALSAQTLHLADYLRTNPGVDLGDVCSTINRGRALFAHRAALTAATVEDLQKKLSDFVASGTAAEDKVGVVTRPEAPEVAFLFTGQGSQYAGMGRGLYESEPVFKEAMDRCEELLGELAPNRTLLSILYGPDSDLVHETRFTQPALFALEYSLAELLMSWGIRPSFAMGHSVGEYVAACVAGSMNLETAITLIAARGRLMQELPAGGGMAAVLAGRDLVERVVRRYPGTLAIAAINGPANTVISGSLTALESAIQELERDGIVAQRLIVSHAFHSPLLDTMLDSLERAAAKVTHTAPRISLISNLTGSFWDGAESLNASYWRRHAREAVDFAGGMRTLYDEGCRVFVEIGPSPVLTGMGKACIPESGTTWAPTLRRGAEDWKQMLGALAELYVQGVRIDWPAVERGQRRKRLALPTYPFERQRCWIENAEPTRTPAKRRQEEGNEQHPILGQRFASARGEALYPARLSLQRQPFLRDHRVHGMYVAPAPVYLELALAALRDSETPAASLEDVLVLEPLVLGEEQEWDAQVVVERDAMGQVSMEIFARPAENDAGVWKRHATARAAVTGSATGEITADVIDQVRQVCVEEERDAFYTRLRFLGVEFGPCFQGIERLWRSDGEAVGRIRVPAELSGHVDGYHLHPAVMDSCLQLLGASFPWKDGNDGDDNYLMVGIDRYTLQNTPGSAFWAYARLRDGSSGSEVLTGDIFLLADDGRELARLEGVKLKRARREALLRNAQANMQEWLYEVQWPVAPAGSGLSRTSPQASSVVQLAESVANITDSLAREHDLEAYQRLINELEELATAYVWHALDSIGWRPHPGERIVTGALAGQLGIDPRRHRLFGRLLEMLGEDAALTQTAGEWQVVRVVPLSDPRAIASRIRAHYPQFDGEIALLESCGEALGSVLRGDVDPVQLLFPGGSMAAVEKLTQGSPAARAYNSLVGRIMEQAVVSAGGRPLRVLEIGAGTGGTTASVLPALPPTGTEYAFTDVSRLFLSRAEQKFSQYSFVSYRLLDIELDPTTQGFPAHEFDIIIAANVLHATSDLRRTLINARRLLAPSGLLILLEGTGPQRWVDLTFGLTEGWWKFTDLDLRPSHPLLPRAGWVQLLAETGFGDASALPALAPGDTRYMRQAVVLASGPDATGILHADAIASISRRSATRWLLLGEGGGIANHLETMFANAGVLCTRAVVGSDFATDQTGRFILNPDRPSDFDQLLATLPEDSGATTLEVVDFLGYDNAGCAEPNLSSITHEIAAGSRAALNLTQALVRAQKALRPRLWLVTRNGQPVAEDTAVLDVGQSVLWGIGRTIANEHPELWGGMLDAGPGDIQATASLIARETEREAGEDQVAYRNGVRHLARLRRPEKLRLTQAVEIRADRTYLVTGGTGGMGVKVARWLIEKGARHLVVTGRSGAARMTPDEQKLLDSPGVFVRAADATKKEDMAAVFADIEAEGPPLAGVIHVAGIFDDRVLMGQDWARFEKVLAPKVRGGWILHELTQDLSLDFFVLFSSGASFLAPVGLGNYAAANAFLDALAHYRQRLGLPAISIDWGPWENLGMAEAVGGRRHDQWAQAGFAAMTYQQGLAVTDGLIASGAPQAGVLIVDWMKYAERLGHALPPLYTDLTRQRPSAAARPMAAPSTVEAIQRASAADRKDLVVQHVCAHVIAVLGFDKSYRLDPEQGLFDLGMDSLTAVELKNRLQTAFGQPLPATLLFDYPNVQRLSEYLMHDVFKKAGSAEAAESSKEEDTDDSRSDLTEDELAQLLAEKLEQLW